MPSVDCFFPCLCIPGRFSTQDNLLVFVLTKRDVFTCVLMVG